MGQHRRARRGLVIAVAVLGLLGATSGGTLAQPHGAAAAPIVPFAPIVSTTTTDPSRCSAPPC